MVGVEGVNVSGHLQRDAMAGFEALDELNLFFLRPVDGSGDRKILSPPDVVVRWKA